MMGSRREGGRGWKELFYRVPRLFQLRAVISTGLILLPWVLIFWAVRGFGMLPLSPKADL